MSNSKYLIIHKDHALTIHGVNSGAEMATLSLARFLQRAGHAVVVAAQLVEDEQVHEGVSFWDLQDDFNVTAILERARELGSYHLISGGRAQAILESRNESACQSRILISHDRSGNDTGIQPAVLTRVADAVICVSRAQRDVFVSAGANPEKVHVVHNGVDLDIFSAGEVASRDYQKLVFAGALVPDKGIQLLIPAFAALKTKYPQLTLDVYGSASLWGRDVMFNEKEIAEQVPGITFHGNVAQAEIAAAYRTAGIAVVPSIWFDPFPLSSIEAQVCGCPVVTCDVGGLKEGVKDGETGIVITDITQDSLTRTLDTLLQDVNRLQKMSERALKSARTYFNWERVVTDIEHIVAAFAVNGGDSLPVGATETMPQSFVEKRIGFLTTWNQECGLATYAKFLLDEFEADTYVVLPDRVTPAHRLLLTVQLHVASLWCHHRVALTRWFDSV
jgi:glycosyltransferase involved in cell wall biosynthesis